MTAAAAQTPLQFGGQTARPADIEAGGYRFAWEQNREHESYNYVDPATRWTWGVFRNRNGTVEMTRTWLAYVCQPGPTTPSAVLNTALYKIGGREIDHHGPLYHLDPYDPAALLAGLAKLIGAGGWPDACIKPDGGQKR